MDIDFVQLFTTLGTLATGGALGFLSKSGRIKAKADAYTAMAKSYEYRIKSLHETIETCNNTIKDLQERIAELNHALDDKTDIIRKYVEDIMRLGSEVIAAQKEIAELRVALEYLAEWRCEHPDCNDPRGRRPPNGKLYGQTFRMPAIMQIYKDKIKSTFNLEKRSNDDSIV